MRTRVLSELTGRGWWWLDWASARRLIRVGLLAALMPSCKDEFNCEHHLEYHIEHIGGEPWLILTSFTKDEDGTISVASDTMRTRIRGRTIAQAIKSLCPDADVETVRPAAPPAPVITPRGGVTALDPVHAVFADFNRDDRTDVALADRGGNRVLIRLQAEDGTFGDAEAFAAGRSPEQVRVGDFDRDEIVDLVVANAGESPTEAGGLSLLIGRGDGTFEDALALPVGGAGTVNDVVVADLNGDQIEDLTCVLIDGSGNPAVNLRLGNGDGTFRADATLPAPGGGSSVVVADVNSAEDGFPDIVTNGSILLGMGDGTFHAAESYAATFAATLAQAGDLDGDGLVDLAAAGQNHVLSVLGGNGDGTFRPPRHWLCGGAPSVLRFDDFDGDGKTDIFLSNVAGTDGTQVFRGDGSGGFAGPRVLPTVPSLRARIGAFGAAAGEFTGDGIIDLVVANGAELQGSIANPFLGGRPAVLLPGLGAGEFGDPETIAGAAGHAVVSGDWNGDGRADVAFSGVGVQRPQVFIWLGNGDGTFTAGAPVDLPGTRGDGRTNTIVTALIDGGNTADLVVANSGNGDAAVLLGDGLGAFSAASSVPVGPRPSDLVVANLDGDAFPDLALTWAGGFGALDGGAAVAFGRGDGTFAPPAVVRSGGAPDAIVAADFDGDGDLDLAVSSEIDAFDWDIEILESAGDGGFTFAGVLGLEDYLVSGLETADVDRDGRPDLAARIGGTRMLALRGLGDLAFAVIDRTPLGGGRPEGVDLDGDGWVDLLSASGSGFLVVEINPFTLGSARPVLDIARIGALLRLSWPAEFPDWWPGRSSALTPPWAPVPGEAMQQNRRLFIDVAPEAGAGFFRLEQGDR